MRISREKKILIFKILNSFLIVYFIKSPRCLLSFEYLEKNYFFKPLFEGKMRQRGEPYLLFSGFHVKKKILIFKILISFLIVYFIKSPKSLLSFEYLEKNYFINPLFERKMIQRGTLIYFFQRFKRKKNFNFQNIKLIFNR